MFVLGHKIEDAVFCKGKFGKNDELYAGLTYKGALTNRICHSVN